MVGKDEGMIEKKGYTEGDLFGKRRGRGMVHKDVNAMRAYSRREGKGKRGLEEVKFRREMGGRGKVEKERRGRCKVRVRKREEVKV